MLEFGDHISLLPSRSPFKENSASHGYVEAAPALEVRHAWRKHEAKDELDPIAFRMGPRHRELGLGLFSVVDGGEEKEAGQAERRRLRGQWSPRRSEEEPRPTTPFSASSQTLDELDMVIMQRDDDKWENAREGIYTGIRGLRLLAAAAANVRHGSLESGKEQ